MYPEGIKYNKTHISYTIYETNKTIFEHIFTKYENDNNEYNSWWHFKIQKKYIELRILTNKKLTYYYYLFMSILNINIKISDENYYVAMFVNIHDNLIRSLKTIGVYTDKYTACVNTIQFLIGNDIVTHYNYINKINDDYQRITSATVVSNTQLFSNLLSLDEIKHKLASDIMKDDFEYELDIKYKSPLSNEYTNLKSTSYEDIFSKFGCNTYNKEWTIKIETQIITKN